MSDADRPSKSIALIGGSALIGGTEVFNRRLTGLLTTADYRVTALRLHSHRGTQSRVKHLAKLCATAMRALVSVMKNRPDRVIVSAANVFDLLAADLIARLTGRRDIVLICHFNAAWRFWSVAGLVRRFVSASTRLRVFCIASNQKAFFLSHGIHVEEENFPNFLNFTPAERAPRPAHTPGAPVIVIYAGRILPEKRLAELAGFLAALADDSLLIQLRLVGACDTDYVDQIAAHIGPHFDILFLGPTDEEGVSRAMSEADIFASFSASDTLPLNMLEAATHGLPILTERNAVTEDVAALTDQVIFVEDGASAQACRALVQHTLTMPHSPNSKALVAANEARAFHLLELPQPTP